jgi:hypothetical protein
MIRRGDIYEKMQGIDPAFDAASLALKQDRGGERAGSRGRALCRPSSAAGRRRSRHPPRMPAH